MSKSIRNLNYLIIIFLIASGMLCKKGSEVSSTDVTQVKPEQKPHGDQYYFEKENFVDVIVEDIFKKTRIDRPIPIEGVYYSLTAEQKKVLVKS